MSAVSGRGLRRTPGSTAVAIGIGALLGLVAALLAAERSAAVLLLLGALIAPFAVAIAGDVRRVLLGIVLLNIPFQWDKYFGYRTDVDALAALAGWGISATTLALGGLYALWIAQLLLRPETEARPRPAAVAIPATFFAILLASSAVADDRTVAGFQVAMYAQALLLAVYVASTVRSRSDVRFIVVMLIAGLCLESLVTLAMWGTGNRFQIPGIATRSTESAAFEGSRVGGTIGSPNNAAAYFAFMSALAASVFLSHLGDRLRRLALVSAGLGLTALVLTQSRGGWIAGMVSIVTLAFAGRGRRLPIPAVAGVSIALVLVLIPLQGTISDRLVHSDAGAAAGRVPLMQMAGEMIEDHPILGVGANNYVIELPGYAGGRYSAAWLSSVHNKYLLIWSEAGAFALLAFLAIIGTTIAGAWRLRRAADPLFVAVGAGLAAAVAGHAVHMNFDIFAGGTTTEMLWLSAGLVASPALATAARAAPAAARQASRSRARTTADGLRLGPAMR